MRRFLASASGELRGLLGDRGVLLVLLGGTLFYALFYPLPYRDQMARDVPVVVVDLDRSAASRQLTRMLDAGEPLRVAGVLREPAEGEALMRRGEVAGLIEIPAGFERQLLRGEVARLGAWGNAAYMLLYSQVATGAGTTVGSYSASRVAARLEGGGLPGVEAASRAAPVGLALHELFNPAGGYGSYVVPAVLVLILQQTLLIAIGMRGAGRAGSAPVGAVALLGRGAPYLGIHLLLALLILIVVYRVYAFASLASVPASLLVLLPFLCATIAFGLLLTHLFRHRETVLQAMMLVSMPTLFLAGFAWPVEAMPAPLVALGQLLPSTTGIDAFVRFHHMGASFTEVLPGWLGLWVLAAGYFAAALLAGRWRGRVRLSRSATSSDNPRHHSRYRQG